MDNCKVVFSPTRDEDDRAHGGGRARQLSRGGEEVLPHQR